MKRADADRLAWALGQLHRIAGLCSNDGPMDDGFKKLVKDTYAQSKVEFRKYELSTALDRLDRAENYFSNIDPYPRSELKRDIHETVFCVESELTRVYFTNVAAPKAKEILETESLWGRGIEVFSSAKHDALEASYCYALGRNDSCVHHCMMVLERGFCSLAHKLGFDPGARSWGSVIDDLEKEIASRQRALKAKKPSDLLTFLAAAAKEFTYFKDAWRNHSAHGRARYDENDARKVLMHTRDFMDLLSTRLKDRKI